MTMKTFLSLFLLSAIPCLADYSLSWSTVDSGGGRSSGDNYTLDGTIGQPDAATSSGGVYTLQGGYWSAFTVPGIEDAPILRILSNGENVTLAWPNPSTGFLLQESSSLILPDWSDLNLNPGIVGDEKQISRPIVPEARYYRLRKL